MSRGGEGSSHHGSRLGEEQQLDADTTLLAPAPARKKSSSGDMVVAGQEMLPATRLGVDVEKSMVWHRGMGKRGWWRGTARC